MSANQTLGADQPPADGPGRAAQPPPGGSQPKPKPSKAVRRRRRRRILACGVGGVVLAWWLGWASPLTLVEHVVVDVPRGLSADSIRLASGISVADHVPAVDAQAVRIAIMTAIPAVADVELERGMPHTITLRITPRSPLAAVESGKGYLVMDSGGVIYDRVGQVKGLPVVKASDEANRDVGRGVLLAIPVELRKQVTKVTARSRDDVTLGLRDGATVRWGGVEDSALKARVLAGLTAVKAAHYDVSAPLLPTTSGSM